MTQEYTIKLPSEYLEHPQKEDLEKELGAVQAHFDDTSLQLEPDFISFIFLKGFYSHINRSTLVMGVFVNTLPDEIFTFGGSLKLRHINNDDFSAEVDILARNESIEQLKTNEGVLVHIEIPTEGLTGNLIIEANEIEATFANIEYARLSDEASKSQQVDLEDKI